MIHCSLGNRQMLMIAATLVAAMTMFSVSVVFAGEQQRQPELLHGQVFSSEITDALEKVGIKCVAQGSSSHTVLFVDTVRSGSAAFYKGMSPGDRIQTVSPTNSGLILNFLRDGTRYQVAFTAPIAAAASNKSAPWVARMQSDIEANRDDELKERKREEKHDEEPPPKFKMVPFGEHPISGDEVAKVGTDAVKQSHYPNCWFLAAISAIANTPGGSDALAKLIVQQNATSYRVNFLVEEPNKWMEVTDDEIKRADLHDKTAWARILDCACLKKWPGNDGASGVTGLVALTGQPANWCDPEESSVGELDRVLTKITKEKSPAICGTRGGDNLGVIAAQHAFAILAYEPKSGMVTLMNPWNGDDMFFNEANIRKKALDTEGDAVRLLSHGLVQVHLNTMAKHFDGIVWVERPASWGK